MTSLISCVLTDILTIAGQRVAHVDARLAGSSGDTLPKKSTTPTWPAGMTVKNCERARSAAKPATAVAAAPAPRDTASYCAVFAALRAARAASSATTNTITLSTRIMAFLRFRRRCQSLRFAP